MDTMRAYVGERVGSDIVRREDPKGGAQRGLLDAPFGVVGPGFVMEIFAYAQGLANAQSSAATASQGTP
jgi:hypothetical protein